MTRRTTLLVGVLVGALGTVLAGGIAWAAIPDGNGVIHGCYAKRDGVLRVIDTGSACTSKEQALNWGQTGPPGQPGAPGATGATGPAGASACPETTVSGGTNDVVVTTSGRVSSRLVEQFTPVDPPSPTTFMCAGSLSNFEVTISAGGATGLLQGYIVTLHVLGRTPTTLGCTFGTFLGTNGLTCSDTRTVEIDPGSEVYVEINPEASPAPRSFDWSADIHSPAAVYP